MSSRQVSGFLKEKWVTGFLFALLAGLFLLNFCWKFIQAGSYAPDLGGFERNVIWGIQRVMAGHPLYSHPDAEPFSMVQYMPLYYYLVAGLAGIAGIDPADAHAVYAFARGINLCLSILLITGIFFLLRRYFRSGLLPAFGFSVLAFLLLDSFTISGRPDMLKSFFFLSQVFVLVAGNAWKLRYRMASALGLSLLCFLSKQDGLLAFGIMPISFLLAREWKNFLIYGMLSVALSGLVLLVFQLHYDGNFLVNVFGALQNGISISWFMSVFASFFARHAFLFAPALVLAYEFSLEKHPAFRVLAAGFFLAFFPALFTSLKFGSGPNYFQEAVLLSCLLIPVAFSGLRCTGWFRFSESRYLLFTLIILLQTGVSAMNWLTGVFLNQEGRLKAAWEADREVALQLQVQWPDSKFLLLTDRQWEDNLTTLLSEKVINPNRDVSAQVYSGKDGKALQQLNSFVKKSGSLLLVTRKGQNPGFPGLDFLKFRSVEQIDGYQIWKK